jgi:excisionase family DNA binding protein
MKMHHEGWLTVHQACRRLKVSRHTLLRLIDTGELPAYKIGWMIRLRVDDVEAYRRQQGADDDED